MGIMKTPGVYILEKNAFPNSVVEVATAVPAFIGYTELAENKGNTLHQKPWRVTSMAEYHQYFGGAPTTDWVRFKLTKQEAAEAAPDEADAAAPAAEAPPWNGVAALLGRDAEPLTVNGTGYQIEQTRGRFLLYYALRQFFMNGGGPCYIVSAGRYNDKEGVQIKANAIDACIKELEKELEPTMVVIPEAVLLPFDECIKLQQASLAHCGEVMKNRVSILDVWEGYRGIKDAAGNCVAKFRGALGTSFLAFGAAYYPWTHTSVLSASDLSLLNISNGATAATDGGAPTEDRSALEQCMLDEVAANPALTPAKKAELKAEINKIHSAPDPKTPPGMLADTLNTVSGFYRSLMTEMAKRLNLLPPSAAMAGIYTRIDNARGVWKAPANVSLSAVVAPAVPISNADQEDLNVTPQGKSINAIRAFIGEGTLVWGARTLDGNSLDWRYINVRRTMIMLEESIRLAAKAMVFEPNVGNTWVTVNGMITNFLTGIWKRGGLAGAVPEDAFSVHVGLGETMTPEDILEGIMRVTVLVAISRPAEFIEITFQQQMQKS